MNQMKYLQQLGASQRNRAILHQGIVQSVTNQQSAAQPLGYTGHGLGIPAAYGNQALQQKADQAENNFGWTPRRQTGLGIVRPIAGGRLSDAFHGSNLNQPSPDVPAVGHSPIAWMAEGGRVGYVGLIILTIVAGYTFIPPLLERYK